MNSLHGRTLTFASRVTDPVRFNTLAFLVRRFRFGRNRLSLPVLLQSRRPRRGLRRDAVSTPPPSPTRSSPPGEGTGHRAPRQRRKRGTRRHPGPPPRRPSRPARCPTTPAPCAAPPRPPTRDPRISAQASASESPKEPGRRWRGRGTARRGGFEGVWGGRAHRGPRATALAASGRARGSSRAPAPAPAARAPAALPHAILPPWTSSGIRS